jgi:hypothetical protein
MNIREKVYFLPCLWISCFFLGGCQVKPTAAAESADPVWGPETLGLRCAIQVASERWRPGEPALVSVVIENRSGKHIEFKTIPSFEMNEYWCPVDLREGRGLKANARAPLVLEKGASLHLTYDLSQLGWGEVIGAAWPAQQLFSLVSPGNFRLRLNIQLTDGQEPLQLDSNEVAVAIGR